MKTFYSKALKYTAALLLCTATAGCTSFLDEKTYSFVSGDDLYTTAANAELALTGVYDILNAGAIQGTGNQPLWGRGMHYLMMLGDEIAPNGISDPHHQIIASCGYNEEADFVSMAWFGLFVGIDRANHIIQKVPAIDHGPQTPRRDRQRSEAAARPLPALSGVALGRSAPAQYAQLVGRGSARTARQGLCLHRGRPRQSLQGASRPQFERKRPRQQMDRGRLSAQDVYLSGLLQGEPRGAGTRLADQQFRLGRCRSVLEKSRGHRRRYLRTQRLQAHQALPLQLSGRHQKQSERGVHDGRTDRSGRLERIFPLRLLGRAAGQRRHQRRRLRLDTPDGRAV